MRTWVAIQEWAIFVAVFVAVVVWFSRRRRAWIHIRGRNRHRVVTSWDLWGDPGRYRRDDGFGGSGDAGGDFGDGGGDGGGGDGGGD